MMRTMCADDVHKVCRCVAQFVQMRCTNSAQKKHPSLSSLRRKRRVKSLWNYSNYFSSKRFIISQAALATEVPGPKMAATPAL